MPDAGPRRAPLLGVFVGGASRRMGGRPKGLLPHPIDGRPLVAHLVALGRELGMRTVLVGDAGPYRSVAEGVARLRDEPPGIGPLGGLSALLAHAGDARVVALACDMPSVTAAAITTLLAHPSPAAVVAPRRGPAAPWEPLFARYDAPPVRPVLLDAVGRGVRSFQRLFADLRAAGLEVAELLPDARVDEALADWDAPGDLRCRR